MLCSIRYSVNDVIVTEIAECNPGREMFNYGLCTLFLQYEDIPFLQYKGILETGE